MAAGIKLIPGESSYRVWLNWNEAGVGSKSDTSPVILAPQTWAQLSLRLDSASRRASAYLDARRWVSFGYKPENFVSFDNASLWGWLGDGGEPIPEPSSFVALGSGLVALAGFARRRRRPGPKRKITSAYRQ